MDRTQKPKDRPNLKTDEMTPGGRPIWKDKDTGENYSERTVSFDIGGIWYTMPTVAKDGSQYSKESIRGYVVKNGPVDFLTGEELPSFKSEEEAVDYAIKRSDTRRLKKNDTGYAQGGVVNMNKSGLMNKMYKEGGLATDGMDVDPVSGNDIPVGSNAEDVRDDVDAKLSTGEYVIPADVVKYVGVAQLEKLVNKAKDGLEVMEEDGRIGGEPVDDAEEVVLTLGGDLNTLDGYATGGMVPGTDIDGIINRVKAAAMKDPSIINMLKAKGIFVQEPQPQGKAQQQAMAQGAVPSQAAPPKMQGKANSSAYAAGGVVQPSSVSDYNPYAYTPGFSAQSGYTSQAPVVGGAPAPGPQGQTCSVGYIWDTTKGMCVPDLNAPSAPAPAAVIAPTGGNDNDGPSQEPADPNAWLEKYDYSNPETILNKTMTTLGYVDPDGPPAEIGFLESMTNGLLSNIGGGLVGKAMAAGTVAEANANAIILESKGFVDEASKIRKQVADYEKEKGIEGWPSAMRNGEGLAKRALSTTELTDTINTWSTDPTVIAASVTPAVTPVVTPAASAAAVNTLAKNNSKDGKLNDAQQAQQNAAVAASKAKSAKSVAASEKAQGLGPDEPGGRTRTTESGEKKETYSSKVSRGGGFAKGGFVQPRSKTPTPKAKKNNKKGLGRKQALTTPLKQ